MRNILKNESNNLTIVAVKMKEMTQNMMQMMADLMQMSGVSME